MVRRLYVIGRGHVTVIDNPDSRPINPDSVVQCEDGTRIHILGVERWTDLMTVSKPLRYWGIVTDKATEGIKINIIDDLNGSI